jgi:hypothetical protein
MIVEVQVTINGSRAAVWAVITNVEGASKIISGIKNIEVVERPTSGLVGLKWRETRILFGKPATVEKCITEAADNEFFNTKAESDGSIFFCTKRISESSGGVMLTEIHESRPQTIVAKLMSIPIVFFKGVWKKAILQDLNDVKAAVERK